MSRVMPIIQGARIKSIPWSVIEEHENQAQRNHYQSLSTLARRGGLSACEALAIIENRPWHSMLDDEAERRLIEAVQRSANI